MKKDLQLKTFDAGILNDYGGGNVAWWLDYIRSLLGEAHDFYQDQADFYYDEVVSAPIPMVLTCYECGEDHIDEGIWEHKLHRTHQCQHCGYEWRPALVPTVGVSLEAYTDLARDDAKAKMEKASE